MNNKKTFKVDLEALIKMNSENLYSDRGVFVRECIQNASDSIEKRRIKAERNGQLDVPKPVIRIHSLPDDNCVLFEDNGAGFTREELDQNLSTIGHSGTRALRESLSEDPYGKAHALIGQFGIGFLSAFLVAHRVEVLTKSQDGTAWRWICDGSAEYSIESATRAEVGTTCQLFIRREHSDFVRADRLHQIATKYCDLLQTPIYINDSNTPINRQHAPWDAYPEPEEDLSLALESYWQEMFPEDIPLRTFSISASHPSDDVRGSTPKLKGVLGISSGWVDDSAGGAINVHKDRMFVTCDRTQLAPDLPFVRGIVEIEGIELNAARDGLRLNERAPVFQRMLRSAVVEEIKRLFGDDHAKAKRLMDWHCGSVIRMALAPGNESLFADVADFIIVATNRGKMTMKECIDAIPQGRSLYYSTTSKERDQAYFFGKTGNYVVIDATKPYYERFIQRYQESFGVRVTIERCTLTTTEPTFKEPCELQLAKYAPLTAAFKDALDAELVVKTRHFEPTSIPSLLVIDAKSESIIEAQKFAQHIAFPEELRGMVHDLSKQAERHTLLLNLDHPLISSLHARGSWHDQLGQQSLQLIKEMGICACGQASREDMQKLVEQAAALVDSLLRINSSTTNQRGLDQSNEETSTNDSGVPLALVVGSCASQRFSAVANVVQSVISDYPYAWETHCSFAEQSWRVHEPIMKRTDLVFVHSDMDEALRSKVLAWAEALKIPAVILLDRSSTALSILPDLQTIQCFENEKKFAAQLRQDLKSCKDLLPSRHSHALNPYVLKLVADTNDYLIEMLPRICSSCEQFIATDSLSIARQLDVDVNQIQNVQRSVSSLFKKQIETGDV